MKAPTSRVQNAFNQEDWELKMKKIAFATAATLLLTGAASAADLAARPYTKAPAPMVSVYNWTGFYIGVNAGGAWSESGTNFGDASGFVGGGQIGYNWQMGSFVLGGEADLAVASFKTNLSDNKYRTDLLSSLRARLGFAFDRIMIYGTGGVGVAKGKVYSSDYPSKRFTTVRPVLGAGAEFAVTNNFLLRAEFLDFVGGKKKVVSPEPEVNTVRDTRVARVGFSYKF